MKWYEVLTLLIAGYGAILATYTAVTESRAKRRVVTVKLTNGFLAFGTHISNLHLFIEAANPGSRPVTIVAMGILLPDGETMYMPPSPGAAQLPLELGEGKNCRVWVGARDCASELPRAGYSGVIKLRGFADDATGTRYVSKQFAFNVNEWLKASRQSA